MTILSPEEADFQTTASVAIVGAGACGLVAALTLNEAGKDCLILERDAAPGGSTALSSGMIPAAGTRLQAAAGVLDSPAQFSRDIQGKSKGRSDETILNAVTQAAGKTVDWLDALPEVELALVEGFLYPGHSVPRMHAPRSRTGESLIAMLSAAALAREIPIVGDAHVTGLFAERSARVHGCRIERPDGAVEDIGCGALILACNGYGGNPDMVAAHIPEMASADYFGHRGNQGDAVTWGLALGGEAKHMTGYQGHGSVATPHGILITWALMMEGGIQVNSEGHRFANEHRGYSEHCAEVLAQPGQIAWAILDERLHTLGLEFSDYCAAENAGAVRRAETLDALAAEIGVPPDALTDSVSQTHRNSVDRFGRDLSRTPGLVPPFRAVRVTGALFHTQGGLRVDANARVLKHGSNRPLENLYAGGGAACGVSGPDADGYLSGNGLLTAVTLGRLAGLHAGAQEKSS